MASPHVRVEGTEKDLGTPAYRAGVARAIADDLRGVLVWSEEQQKLVATGEAQQLEEGGSS